MTLTLTTSINATIERMTVTGTVSASIVPGAYRFRLSSSDEIMDLVAFAPVNPQRPWPVDPNRWVILRHVIGTTATTHTNGATVQAIVDEFTVSLTDTPPDPLDPDNPGETPTLAEVLAAGNDTGGTNIYTTVAGDVAVLNVGSGNVIDVDTTLGAGNAARANIHAVSLNADASTLSTAEVQGNGTASSDRGATVAGNGDAAAGTTANVGGDGNVSAGVSATITGSGTITTAPILAVVVDGDIIADAQMTIGGNGGITAGQAATITGDGNASVGSYCQVNGAGFAGADMNATAMDGSAVAGSSATAGGAGTAYAVATATAVGGTASIGPVATATRAEIQVNGLPLYTTAAAGPPGSFASLFYVDSTAVTGGTWLWDFVTGAYVRIAGVF